MAICSEEFREALRNWASGVTVVTAKDRAGNLHGITVSAFASVSLQPPLVLICIDKFTGSHYAFAESPHFVVNILSDQQEFLSRQFATPLLDKFDNVEFTRTANGVPVLSGALCNLECRLVLSYEGGDHTIFIGEIEKAVNREGKPLLYFQGNYADLAPRL
ncbi:MAG: flavin reductase family protein [Acidobacteriota bacterium]|nr:flavin reductase family protein [Acidobacteriota bacterium]